MQRYFLTTEATYETLRQSLNTQLSYPNSLGKSVFQTALYAPRDGFRRVLLAVDTAIANYAAIAAAIAPLLDSDAMEEIDEATYRAAVASATAGASAWDDITGKPSTFAPSAHKSSHATGGSDALTPADIGASAVGHAHAVADITGLANVATSGSYNDLTNKPTIPSAYTLPTASATVLGGVKIGSGLSIDGSSVLSTTYSYTLPNATTSTLGGVIVGTGLSVTSGTVSVTYGTTSGTACQGNDSRLSDSRTPTSHASSHASGGSDAISIAASQITSGTVAAARLGSGSASSNTYLRGDQSWYAPTASDVGAAATAEVLDFTVSTKPAAATGSNGSYTYTIPATAKAVRVYAIGGGAGGGSGRRGAAGSARFGGGGGSTSGVLDIVISSNDFGSNRTATITVGSGGAGGAAVTANDTNGNNGTNGAASSVTINSKTFGAAGGGSGSGGSNVSGNTGNPLGAQFPGQVGGNSSATANAGNASYGSLNVTAPGGGGGGGISTGDTSYNGGGTRFDAPYNGSTNFNNGGTAPGGTGAAGLSNSFGLPLPGGSGSGGGAGNASTAGGAGGNGGDYGGGGGGGGASFNGFSSGAGGNGGNGFVRLVVYY